MPTDTRAAMTVFQPDVVGTYVLDLVVTDDSGQTDRSGLRIVATGAILGVDAGPNGSAMWLDMAQLSGAVTTLPGKTATYSWRFVSRPSGSTASITNSNALSPTFVPDATGTYVLALEAWVGDEVRTDTTMVDVTASGISFGTGNLAYTYSTAVDRVVYARERAGRAEIVKVDPTTGADTALDIGAFTPRSIAVDPLHAVAAVGGLGIVVTVAVGQFVQLSSRAVPGCTAAQVALPYQARVHCFPIDGDVEPISSVNMTTGEVTQIPCPVRSPHVTSGAANWMYMVDGASPQFYLYDAFSSPPLQVLGHGTLAGIGPPVIAAGTNQPFAITGNGFAINLDATLRFDLHTSVSAGTFSAARYEIAIVSGSQLKIFDGMGQTLKLDATLPSVGGTAPSAKLLAYSSDGHRLIIVGGTAAGDIAYTVPR